MIQTRWISGGSAIGLLTPNPPDHADPELLFQAWQCAGDKFDFMASLRLVDAQCLCDLVMQRVPKHVPVPRTFKKRKAKKRKANV